MVAIWSSSSWGLQITVKDAAKVAALQPVLVSLACVMGICWVRCWCPNLRRAPKPEVRGRGWHPGQPRHPCWKRDLLGGLVPVPPSCWIPGKSPPGRSPWKAPRVLQHRFPRWTMHHLLETRFGMNWSRTVAAVSYAASNGATLAWAFWLVSSLSPEQAEGGWVVCFSIPKMQVSGLDSGPGIRG